MKEKTNLGIVRETFILNPDAALYPLYVSIYYILCVGSLLCVWPLCELIEASVWKKRPDVVYFFSQGAIYLCVLHVVHVVHIHFFSNFLYFFPFLFQKLKVGENGGGDLETRCCGDGVYTYRCSSSWETCVGGGLKKKYPRIICVELWNEEEEEESLFSSIFFSVSFQRVVIYLEDFNRSQKKWTNISLSGENVSRAYTPAASYNRFRYNAEPLPFAVL